MGRLVQALVNCTTFTKEYYEARLCYLFPCYEVRYRLRKAAASKSGGWATTKLSVSARIPKSRAVATAQQLRNEVRGKAIGQNVTLDNTSVTVRWISGTPKVGDYWDVWVSYPFLRMPVSQLCVQCHKDQAMGHERVSGNDPGYLPNGSRIFSHPIGEGLNANGLNTDRTASNPDANARAILDASGVAQTSGDGNATNDYLLDGSGAVQCTTCHAVHNADSNSLTVDKR